MKAVMLTNLTVIFVNGRNAAFAIIRDSDTVIRHSARLAEQLAVIKREGWELANADEVLTTLVMTLGFSA